MKMARALIVSLGFISASSFGSAVTGSVKLTSKAAPKAATIKMSADPACNAANAGKPVLAEDYVVNNGALANVFVYVKDFKGAAPAAPTTPVKFDQQGCKYAPHVVGVRVGQPFQIINSDAVLHNVHSMAKINAGFNMGMATKGQTIEKKFTKPETMIKMKCDVHGWMTAYVGVLDHPFFAVSDASGKFSIADLPAGDYKLEAWHEKLGTKSVDLKVSATGGTADFTF